MGDFGQTHDFAHHWDLALLLLPLCGAGLLQALMERSE
jgi:hypothetical protein